MVDRYEMDYHGLHGEDAYMAKIESGEYVLYTDYAELEAENERLKKELGGAHTAIRGLYGAVVTKDEALSSTGAVDTLAEVRTTLETALLSADPYRYIRAALSALEPAAPPSDVSTEGQQPVAWRLDYPFGTQWCDDKYALQVAVDEGVAKVTPLYTRPSEQAVENNLCTLCDTVFSGDICPSCRGHISRRPPVQVVTEVHAKTFYEKYFEDVSELEPRWDDLPFDHRLRTLNALKAAMEA